MLEIINKAIRFVLDGVLPLTPDMVRLILSVELIKMRLEFSPKLYEHFLAETRSYSRKGYGVVISIVLWPSYIQHSYQEASDLVGPMRSLLAIPKRQITEVTTYDDDIHSICHTIDVISLKFQPIGGSLLWDVNGVGIL